MLVLTLLRLPDTCRQIFKSLPFTIQNFHKFVSRPHCWLFWPQQQFVACSNTVIACDDDTVPPGILLHLSCVHARTQSWQLPPHFAKTETLRVNNRLKVTARQDNACRLIGSSPACTVEMRTESTLLLCPLADLMLRGL